MALIERRDRLVTKAELLELVWPGLVVEENNLQVQISGLRKLLGPQTIVTVPGRGYQFTASIDQIQQAKSLAREQLDTPPEPLTTNEARSTNLPPELPRLYGRNEELQALSTLVAEHRLVTVVGAGGIGKSRLAQAVAHGTQARWPDGAWMVELAGLSDPALLPHTAAAALDIKIEGHGTPLEAFAASLSCRTALIVLDNCEHLLDAAAQFADRVLAIAPGVTLLATSQEPLRVTQEQQFRVMPLAVPTEAAAVRAREFGAVALFEARVQAVDPRFTLNDETTALAVDICRQLDGLPLAIELAAARVGTLGLRAVRDKLNARFKLLTGGARTTLRRHQTLRAALEWSHGLLNDAERIVFRRLGSFAGGFTIELAQAVASDQDLDEWAVLDHLSALVDKSLVVADTGEPPRYRLLESARAFALEQLAEAESDEVLRRHAHAMLAFLQRIDSINLDGDLRTDEFSGLLIPELDNLRAAYGWAISELGDQRIAIGLAAHAGSLIDYAPECAEWQMPHLLKVEEGLVDEAVAARYWRALAAGNLSGKVPGPLRVAAAQRAHALYKKLGRPRPMFSSLIRLATYRMGEDDVEGAQAALREARALIQPDWPAEFHIHLLRRANSIVRKEGRLAEALTNQREEVRLAASTGDWRLEVMARDNLVDVLWQIGPLEDAAREARRLADQLRRRPSALADMDVMFANFFGILSEIGRIDEATDVAREGLPLMRRTGNYFLEEWAHLFWRRGQHDVAAAILGAAEASNLRSGTRLQVNERRLSEQARNGVAAALSAEAIERNRAIGAALDDERLLALLAESLDVALRQPSGPPPALPA